MRRVLLSLVFFCFTVSGTCFAQEYVTKGQYEGLVDRVLALEQKLGEQDKCIKEQKQCILDQEKKIADYESKLTQFGADLHRQTGAPIGIAEGLEIGVGGTMIVQGTGNVNNAAFDITKKESRTDATYSADLTIGKEFKETGGKAFLHLEAGRGHGLEDDLTLYSNVNRDAGDSQDNAQVTEFWYEQALFNDKAVLTFGKLDPTAYFDNNEVANDETTQFLGRIFRNSPTVAFPDNTVGLRLAYLPFEWVGFSIGVFDGNSDWEKLGDDLFDIGQVVFKTNPFDQPGNYRFFVWNSNADHTKWLDSEKTKEENYGFGLSFDQKANDIVTIFTRYAWQNPKVYNPDITAIGDSNYSLAHSWSAGVQIEGEPWGRENDVIAFSVGQAIPSNDYKKAGGLLDPVRRAKPEGHLETYYRIYVNEHLSLSPDLQYIWNPFGKDIAEDTSGVLVVGMRAQVDF